MFVMITVLFGLNEMSHSIRWLADRDSGDSNMPWHVWKYLPLERGL